MYSLSEMVSKTSGRMVALAIAVLVVLAAALVSSPALACLHAGIEEGRESEVESIEQAEQSALIYFRDGRQDLFLSTALSADGPISRVGWVVPVPTVPESYGTADPELFTQLDRWMNLQASWREPRERSRSGGKGMGTGGGSESKNFEVLELVRTGPYEITPLEASGEAGLEALKSWLSDNGFRIPSSTAPARWYIAHDWTFLAVDVRPPEGESSLASDAELPPLQLSFPTERAVYPLIFETNQGRFPVTLHLVTPDPVPDEAFRGARRRGFFVAGAGEDAIEQSSSRPDLSALEDEEVDIEKTSDGGVGINVSSLSSGDAAATDDSDTGTSDSDGTGESDGTSSGEGERTAPKSLSYIVPESDAATRGDPTEKIAFNPIQQRPADAGIEPDTPGEAIRLDFPANLKFGVAHHRITRDTAPDVVADALGEAGAWESNSRLAIRTLHAPAINAGVAEPDTWSKDFAVPGFESGRTLNDFLPDSDDDKTKPGSQSDRDDSGGPPEKTSDSNSLISCDGCGHTPRMPPVGIWLAAAVVFGLIRFCSSPTIR